MQGVGLGKSNARVMLSLFAVMGYGAVQARFRRDVFLMFRHDHIVSGFRWLPVSLCLVVLLTAHSPALWGQGVSEERDDIYLTIDADLKSLKAEPRIRMFPWEIYSSFIERIVGVDLLAEESMHLAFAFRESDKWLMALTSTRSAEIQLTDLAKRRFTVVKDEENASREDLRRFSDTEIMVQKLDHVWYAGTMQSLSAFAVANRLPIPNRMDAPGGQKSLLSVALKPSPIRDELLQWIDEDFDVQEDSSSNALKNLIRWVDEVRLDIFSEARLSIRLTIKGMEGVSSDKIVEEIRALQQPNLNDLESYIISKVKSYRLSQREQFAWEAYVARLNQVLIETKAKVDNDRIQYELGSLISVPIAALFARASIEVLEVFRLSNDRFGSQYKLREVNEAVQKYVKEKGTFPLREIQSDDGESLLSWRVALLPYLGYESLYNKFHLDEPWDSPHNSTLLKEMPSIYRNSSADLASGYTTFVAPYGATDEKRKTVWDIIPTSLMEVPEEEQESILLVEVISEAAVPWSSPEDFNVSLQDLRSVLRDPPEGNGVVFLNGSTDYISNAISTVVLLELLNCSTGGNP
jgi:hypothetical protein